MYNINMSEQNLPHFTSFMLKNQPDQTSYLLNKMAQKINSGTTNVHTGGSGAGKLYPTTGQNIDGAMTQKATTDALNTKASTIDVGIALQNKVDKEPGKGLSSNDYTDNDAATVERANRNLMTNATVTASTSTGTLNLKDSFINLATGVTSDTEIPFPVASSSSAGVMNSATFNAVTDNTNNINAILNGAVSISGLSPSPSQADITNAWKTATGLTTVINRSQVHDSTNEKIWTYYTNTNIWYPAPTSGGQVTVSQWTNTSLGIAKGSTNDGQIFAENDGTGSVNGWDELTAEVAGKVSPADLATVAFSGDYDDLTNKPSEKPYTSLERLGSYIYKISFENIPEYIASPITPSGCSSYVNNGKLYRNFDWYYDESPTFIVECKGFKGIAINNLLTDTSLDDTILGQLPYRVVDGINDNGIMMSVHVLYNDWDWHGSGDRSIPLHKVPYLILTNVKSMATISSDLASIIPNITTTPTFEASEYLAQFLITDGTTTYVLAPPTSSSGTYELINITSNPKLANFRWVNYETVVRNASYMQDRPNGVERWNNMTTDFSQLRFTKAYESPTRLSEFIGLDDTDKDSSDAELTAIYNRAHQAYLTRTRDGSLWQTVHNVVYSAQGMEHLYVQEDWDRDYVSAIGPQGETIIEIKLIGETGILSEEQIELLEENDLNVIFNNDGEIFRLSNNNSSLTYKTYMNFDVVDSEFVSGKAIFIQMNKTAANYGYWSKEDVSFSAGTNDYEMLVHKPSLNSVELLGNVSFDDLNITDYLDTKGYLKEMYIYNNAVTITENEKQFTNCVFNKTVTVDSSTSDVGFYNCVFHDTLNVLGKKCRIINCTITGTDDNYIETSGLNVLEDATDILCENISISRCLRNGIYYMSFGGSFNNFVIYYCNQYGIFINTGGGQFSNGKVWGCGLTKVYDPFYRSSLGMDVAKYRSEHVINMMDDAITRYYPINYKKDSLGWYSFDESYQSEMKNDFAAIKGSPIVAGDIFRFKNSYTENSECWAYAADTGGGRITFEATVFSRGGGVLLDPKNYGNMVIPAISMNNISIQQNSHFGFRARKVEFSSFSLLLNANGQTNYCYLKKDSQGHNTSYEWNAPGTSPINLVLTEPGHGFEIIDCESCHFDIVGNSAYRHWYGMDDGFINNDFYKNKFNVTWEPMLYDKDKPNEHVGNPQIYTYVLPERTQTKEWCNERILEATITEANFVNKGCITRDSVTNVIHVKQSGSDAPTYPDSEGYMVLKKGYAYCDLTSPTYTLSKKGRFKVYAKIPGYNIYCHASVSYVKNGVTLRWDPRYDVGHYDDPSYINREGFKEIQRYGHYSEYTEEITYEVPDQVDSITKIVLIFTLVRVDGKPDFRYEGGNIYRSLDGKYPRPPLDTTKPITIRVKYEPITDIDDI